jgi:hypothetical protein
MEDRIDLTLNRALFDGRQPAVVLKIQGPMFELNVWMRPDELSVLEQVSDADWNRRESLQIGRCGDVPAFWSSDAEHLSILVGPDDESWDFGIMVPRHTLAAILSEVRAEQAAAGDARNVHT